VVVGLASLPSAQVSYVQQHLHELQHKKILWPSTIVNRNEVEQRVLWMWSVFFSPTGTHEICVPHTVLQNTIKRIFLLHIYGPRAFEEALIDPLKTLKRDIYPRFAVSELATEMRSRLQSLRVLPPANLLTVAPPANTPFCSRIESDESVDDFIATIELAQVLSDRVLFESFLAYLQSIVSSENLLCVRMIEIFKELTPETDQYQCQYQSQCQNEQYRSAPKCNDNISCTQVLPCRQQPQQQQGVAVCVCV
jgi:hypothetical protein